MWVAGADSRNWEHGSFEQTQKLKGVIFLRLRILLLADLTRSCCCMLVPRSLGHSLVLLGFLLCFLLCCLLSFRQPCVAKAGDLVLFLETKAFCFALCLWNFFAVFCSVHDYHTGYGFEAPAFLVLWFSRLVGRMCGCILSWCFYCVFIHVWILSSMFFVSFHASLQAELWLWFWATHIDPFAGPPQKVGSRCKRPQPVPARGCSKTVRGHEWMWKAMRR